MTEALATFALTEGTANGAIVTRRGKVFQAGNYPDKGISFTPDDLRAAVADFAPVDNDLEHRPSILDSHLGQLTDVELSDDGASLIGTVQIPKWLHDAMGDGPLKTSLAWDRNTKRIVKNGLVLSPRVADAALFDAYAEFAGPKGIQAIHDALVSHGASCHATMAQTHDQTIQKLHDMTRAHGAQCLPQDNIGMSASHVTILDALKALVGLDKTPQIAATTPPARAEEHVRMTATTVPAPVSFAESPEYKAMQAQLATERERREQLEKERREEKAAVFASGVIADKKAYPSERDAIITAYVQFAADDAANPTEVTFSNGAKGGRVDALKALYDARPAHVLSEELVKDGETLIQFANQMETRKQGAEKPITEERRNHLLSLDPVGRQALKDKRA